MNLSDCYKILGLSPDATQHQAKQAYKAMVRRWHPDQFFSDPKLTKQAEEKLKQINIAYSEIKTFAPPDKPHDARDKTKPHEPEAHQQKQKTAPQSNFTKNKNQNSGRAWLDNLVNILNKLADGPEAGRAFDNIDQTRKKHKGRRFKTFDQVLNEMADKNTKDPENNPGFHRAYVFRSNPYKRTKQRGSTIGGIGPVESPGRVRPVTRVRGIGKSR